MKIIRKLYDWVLSWTESKHSNWALFLLAFAESSFFPVPPDVLLIALAIGKPKKSFFYAFICTAGSVLGGIAGYYIGYFVWGLVQNFFFSYIPGFTHEVFDLVVNYYNQNAFFYVLIAAFTPIPYKVFTIAGGVCRISLWTLIIASALGRAGRFFIVAGMIWKFGEAVKKYIDKYFNLLTILFTILLIGGFLVLKKIF